MPLGVQFADGADPVPGTARSRDETVGPPPRRAASYGPRTRASASGRTSRAGRVSASPQPPQRCKGAGCAAVGSLRGSGAACAGRPLPWSPLKASADRASPAGASALVSDTFDLQAAAAQRARAFGRRSVGGRQSPLIDAGEGVVDSSKPLRISGIVRACRLAPRRTSGYSSSQPSTAAGEEPCAESDASPATPTDADEGWNGALSLCHCPGKQLQQGRDGRTHRRDLAADIASLRDRRVSEVWCLLNDPELRTLGLPPQRYAECAEAHGVVLRRYPLVEMTPPKNVAEFDGECVAHIAAAIFAQRRHVVVHCRGGVGRAGLVAACLLLRAGAVPLNGPAAVAAVRKLRDPRAVESQTQRDFVARYADWCRLEAPPLPCCAALPVQLPLLRRASQQEPAAAARDEGGADAEGREARGGREEVLDDEV
eukprot:TRINITY_DN61662_c0_g1_i1.p1 TRINITY_DN61662_c0_g1~~TRINITY_DN61662_c0_g1_i1.p1  ORF type:complete len:427 (+),score=72.31 TRINITY_DN61662_c0_g1_i1:69-1349(+)